MGVKRLETMSKFKYFVLVGVIASISMGQVVGGGTVETTKTYKNVREAVRDNNLEAARTMLNELGDGTNNVTRRYLYGLYHILRADDSVDTLQGMRDVANRVTVVDAKAYLNSVTIREAMHNNIRPVPEIDEFLQSTQINYILGASKYIRQMCRYVKEDKTPEEYKTMLNNTLYYIDADSDRPDLLEIIGFIKSELEKFN